MIIFLIIIIIILLIIGVIWYFNRNKNDNSIILLNSYLRSEMNEMNKLNALNALPEQSQQYPGNINSAIAEINNNIIKHPNNQSINLINEFKLEYLRNIIQI